MSEQPTQTDRRTDRRCATCGGLLSADAEWCGQCLQPVREPEPEAAPQAEPVAATAAVGPDGKRAAVWPCAACHHRNPIEREDCEVCGTSFATIMRGNEAPATSTEPGVALKWSLVFPGLGHVRMGRTAEGVARGALFAWTLASTVVLMAAGGVGGPLMPLFLLFGGATVAQYAIAAVDVRRLENGDRPLVTSRTLLWGAVGLVIVSAALEVVPIVLALGR